MDAWFSYVLKLSELIFNMKLEAYEDACAALVLSAVGMQTAAVTGSAASAAEADSAESTSDAAAGTHRAEESAALSTAEAAADSADDAKADSVAESVSPSGTDHGPTPSQSTTSPMSVKGPSSVSGGDSVTNVAATQASLATPPQQQPQPVSRRPSPPAATPAETVSALLDAMQLRKPLRTIPSRSQLLDDIEAEADVVYQDLEEVYALQPGDVAAMRRAAFTTPHSQPASPPPPEAGRRHASPIYRPADRPFPTYVGGGSGGSQSRVASPTLEHQLLYGELTSVGVRQLQAISMASVSVSREYLTHARSQNFGYGATPPSHSAGGGGGGSYSYSGSHAGSSRHTTSGASLLNAGNVPRGAVVMCVDVGCGNGRLLFEWARLGAAACRRKPESNRRRSHTEDSASLPATPQSTHNNSMAGSTYAAAARRGNLLAADMGPLGVHHTNIVWRGWVGMGIELVPSRIRVARRALVPHYLNLKPALLVPAGIIGPDGQREEPVPLLDPVAPEAIAISNSSGSFSSPASVTSTAISRTAPASTMCSPTSAGMNKTLAARVPQPTARVLLYEGDALAPGVLSNATLCRFPQSTLQGDTLTLLRGGGSMLVPAKAHNLVNGLGGEHMGSLGGIGYGVDRGLCSAPVNAGAATCPYPAVGVAAVGAALNNAYLNNAAAGAYSRKGGAASFMEASMCSVTSNASSNCSTRGGSSAKHNYYRLCRVENGPSLSGREDPHLVVFCCGLGFDDQQVWKLCQRLEDMLLARTAATATTPTRPASMDGFSSSHNLSEDEASVAPLSATNHSESIDAVAASPVAGNPASISSDDNGEVLEEMARGFGQPVSTPTAADPATSGGGSGGGAVGGNGLLMRDMSGYRHWESMTCVLLLRPMDVLAPNFPLFRYATRVYTTQEHPVAAEDTAILLATGNRTDGTAARYVMRDLPISDSPQDANMAGTIQESDVWMTTLETTWMNAAPAWVVRFRF